ncbi:MAG TPA: metal ABC transporter permease [Syntrophorhabdaceae bacterium]|nr:metal ABC transporter permease [Syntrophorhabdaceae bacterium]
MERDLFLMMAEIIDTITYLPVQRAIIASLLCGISCSFLSVFVVLMKMPLIGVSMSHAAFAGAVLGILWGLNPFLSGLLMCLIVAGALGPLSDRTDLAPENMLGIIFSFLMGIAFLGMGIISKTRATALNLMWGSLLTLSKTDIIILSLATICVVLFVVLFFKEIKLIVFNRRLAYLSGIPEKPIYYTLLFLTGMVVSSNLSTVGGLLIFALLVQPGAVALQLTYNLKLFFLIAVISGVASCLFGLILSYVFDIPSGASIVLVSTSIFALAYIFSPKKNTKNRGV